MKKTGIITFHNADNLGAVLQAYALQYTISTFEGCCCEIIDYRCKTIERSKYANKSKSLKDLIKFIPMQFYYYIKRRGFKVFRKENLVMSEKSYNKKTIGQASKKYDVFVAGSDQIWNLECSNDDLTYFLDFVEGNKQKYAYAASIGNYVFKDNEKEKVGELIRDFNKISLREKSALNIIGDIGGLNNIAIAPDPVFLLAQKQWKEIMSKRLCKEKYILVYLIQKDVNVLRNAEEYARKYNCKIINNKKSIDFIMHNSPSDFLSWVFYSDCVFTNSFHGTAFSLIFNKKLAADIEIAGGKKNNRISELLKGLNEERCIMDKDGFQGAIPEGKELMEKMKKQGMDYLGSFLLAD